LLIGDGDSTTNVGAASDITGGVNFDAIKAVLAYDPLTVDLFAAKITETNAGLNDDDNKLDVNLYGVNANYKVGDTMNTVVEAYTFAKMAKDGDNGNKSNKLYVPGLRVSTNPIEGLNVQLEGAYEFGKLVDGDYVGYDVSAFAVQGMVNYALPVMKDMKPVLSGSYTYLSGDKRGPSSNKKAFVDLYSDQNGGRIFKTLFANSNLSVFNAAIEVTPVQDLTTKLSWYGLYENHKDANAFSILQPDGSTAYHYAKRSNRLGNEIDLDLSYAYTEDVKFGVSAGMFFAGTKFGSTQGDSQVAKQLLTSVAVAF
jgi:hypothetical protein